MGAKAKNDIAPLVRTAFVRAIGMIEESDGLTFSELMRDAIRQYGILAVLDRLSKYTVREANVTGKVAHDHKHIHVAVSEINEFLVGFRGPEEDSDTKTSGKDRPVLPH